jgi:hypothetical protein
MKDRFGDTGLFVCFVNHLINPSKNLKMCSLLNNSIKTDKGTKTETKEQPQ